MTLSPLMTALAAAALLPSAASAHIGLTQRQGEAGAYHGAFSRVGHGWGEAATTAFTVRLPDAVPAVRPQPKPGWTITVEREPLDPPMMQNGRPLTERIRSVTWNGGPLAADQFDDFGLLMPLPSTPGDLAFTAVQTCGAESVAWDGADAAHPQPILTVAPAAPTVHHHQ
ncbi:DUF1775 domain-containing protein [Brevundimonas naejangsanensis]|uniref:DUF1775 domain-containing protein n=1 Tax=Brevundimonas naejangsanensis TaxID=588932 RepID=A0A494RIQ0_9CAUL|nr:YcnI family protein [Brevundimonas naejangsanensis]AYG93844.1 DUF1775 domain-containing protein [Brevundimonas naejangsanensis]